MVLHTYNPSPQEAEAGRLKASLGYIMSSFALNPQGKGSVDILMKTPEKIQDIIS